MSDSDDLNRGMDDAVSAAVRSAESVIVSPGKKWRFLLSVGGAQRGEDRPLQDLRLILLGTPLYGGNITVPPFVRERAVVVWFLPNRGRLQYGYRRKRYRAGDATTWSCETDTAPLVGLCALVSAL